MILDLKKDERDRNKKMIRIAKPLALSAITTYHYRIGGYS